MRLSRQSDYAIRITFAVAQQTGGANTQTDVASIAHQTGIPQAYTAKLVQSLAKAGVLRTQKGPRGGVRLAATAEDITLQQIVEAVEGPTEFARCLLWPGECPPHANCPMHMVLDGLTEVVTRYLSSVTLADLLARGEHASPMPYGPVQS
jgi:Rrf2 family protein